MLKVLLFLDDEGEATVRSGLEASGLGGRCCLKGSRAALGPPCSPGDRGRVEALE